MTQNRELELSTLQENLHDALKCWNQIKVFESPISYLKIVEQRRHEKTLDMQTAGHIIIREALDRLEELNPSQSEILIFRYIQGNSRLSTTMRFNIADSTVSTRQREAIESLTRIIYDMEMNEIGGSYHDDQQIRRLIEIPSEYK